MAFTQPGYDFLDDAFERHGTEENELRAMLCFAKAHTARMLCVPSTVHLLSLSDLKKPAFTTNGHIHCWDLPVKGGPISTDGLIKIAYIDSNTLEDQEGIRYLLSDIQAKGSSNLLLWYKQSKTKNYLYGVSKEAIPTLMQRCGITGKAGFAPSCPRDIFLSQCLSTLSAMTMIIKFYKESVGKIFAFLTAEVVDRTPATSEIIYLYEQLTQNDELGATCKYWEYTHDHIMIRCEFTGLVSAYRFMYGLPKDVTCGVELITSDTGESALKAVGYWCFGNAQNIVYTDIESHVHKTEFDHDKVNEFLADMYEHVRIPMDRFAKRLRQLKKYSITTYQPPINVIRQMAKSGEKNASPQANLTNEVRDVTLNRMVAKSLFRKMLKTSDIVKYLGKPREQIISEIFGFTIFDPDKDFTVYDLVKTAFQMPELLYPKVNEQLRQKRIRELTKKTADGQLIRPTITPEISNYKAIKSSAIKKIQLSVKKIMDLDYPALIEFYKSKMQQERERRKRYAVQAALAKQVKTETEIPVDTAIKVPVTSEVHKERIEI